MSQGLDTRTGARAFTLDDLVRYAWSGHIRVPHFQRDFRWARSDVEQLMDSIHRGYPIGSLLLWERPAPADRIQLGDLHIEAPELSTALWVVDGQQRVVSLANVLSPQNQRHSRFAFGYDLRVDRIVPIKGLDDPFIVPLPVIFDLGQVLTWFADHPETALYRDSAFELAKELRQFTVPAYQVVQDDMNVLQDIFDRMNNSGKRLSRAEVFSALTAGTEQDADQRLTIRRIVADVESTGFGTIGDDTVLQCILARRGPDVQREIRWEFDPQRRRGRVDFPHESQNEAFSRGEDALMRAIEFLRSTGVPHFTFLPYRYLIIVLTRFMALHDAGPADLRLLHRWFWRAAVAGPAMAKGSATGVTRVLCGRIDAADASASVQGLLDVVGDAPSEIPNLRRFKTDESAAKIALCNWWGAGPLNPENGTPYLPTDLSNAIEDGNTAAETVRVVFPRRLVEDPTQKLWAANRVLMPTLSEAIPAVIGLLQRGESLDLRNARDDGHTSATWAEVLASHYISVEAESAATTGDVDEFVRLRQDTLQNELRRFLKQRCEWGFENTPPLAEFEIDDLTGADDSA